jgi:hypothetical protein
MVPIRASAGMDHAQWIFFDFPQTFGSAWLPAAR